MRKIYSLVLIAAGLLIGTNVWANLPERPTPPMEPKAPEGIEMVKPEVLEIPERIEMREMVAPQLALPARIAKAPRKAAKEDLLATLYRNGVEPKDYLNTTEDLTALQTEMQDGDSIVLKTSLGSLNITKNIVLNLNENYFYTKNWYNLYIEASGNVKIMNGDLYSTGSEGSCALYITSGNVTLENISMDDDYAPEYGVDIEAGSLTLRNSTIIGKIDGVYAYNNSSYVYVYQYGGSVKGGTVGLLAVKYCYYVLNSGSLNSTDTYYYYNYINIYGGTVSGDIKYGQYYSHITITGGEIMGGLTEKSDYYSYQGSYNDVTISGNPIIHGKLDTKKNVLSITGGTFYDSTVIVDNGYVLEDQHNGTYIVKEQVRTDEAEIEGDKSYPTLADAIAAASDGATINLLTDVIAKDEIAVAKNITIDLKEKSIYSSSTSSALKLTGNIIVKNGTIYATKYNSSTGNKGVHVVSGNVQLDKITITSTSVTSESTRYNGPYYGIYTAAGSVTLTNSKVDAYNIAMYNVGNATLTSNDIYSYCSGIYQYSGSLTINSGELYADYYYGVFAYSTTGNVAVTINDDAKFENNSATKALIYAQQYGTGHIATLTVNGGEFIASPVAIENIGATVNVKGGKFKKPSGNIFSKNSGHTYVSGGFYNTTDIGDAEIRYGCAMKETTVAGEDGDWYEVVKVEAQVNGIGYLHIEDAIAAAVAAGEQYVIVVSDLEDVEVDQSITLCLGGQKLKSLTVEEGKTVIVEGRSDASIGTISGDIVFKGGTYTFDPRINSNVAEGYDVKTIEGEPTKYQVGQLAAQYNGKTYMTLKEAITAAGTADSAIITMVKDLMVYESGTTIAANQNITIDLNGHLISTDDRNALDIFVQGSSLLNNNGILTITDGSEAGNGKITYYCAQPDLSGYSASDVTINNNNKMYVKGGTIENRGIGASSYAIDVTGGLYITKGTVVVPNNPNSAIRIQGTASHREIIIDGGEKNEVSVGRIWLQDYVGDNSLDVTVDIKHALVKDVRLGYSGSGEHKKLIIKLDHVTINEGFFRLDFTPDQLNYKADSCTIQSYYLVHPFQHLTSGLFQFKNDIQLSYENNTQALRDTYPEKEGWKIIPDPNDPVRAALIITAEKLLHDFYQNIKDGYGLVCIDEENKWYEVRPIQGTTGEESEIYGELGNPWHQNKTWTLEDLEEGKDAVPEETTPVLIDHDVYVEENTQAVAASLQIEAGQTLTVKSGATLQIQDAGALFKNETAQLIVEPDAVVTVGSNGVIADNENNIIIKASETEQGVFMCHPDVQLNTKPEATVYLYTKAKQIAGASNYEYIYQRFAIPTSDGEATIYGDDYTNQKLFAGETSYVDAVFGWDNKKLDWQMLARWRDMKPFVGYQVTNNTEDGGITYSFKGNLVGNHDGNFEFAYHPDKFQFFGNSYTAPIYIPTFLDSINKNNPTVQQSIWIYDEGDDNFKPVTKIQAERGLVKYKNGKSITEIRSMQAFIMCGDEGSVTELSYEDAIWGNPRFNKRLGGNESAPRRVQDLDMNVATVRIEAENGQADEVTFFESNEFTQDFDNGADASKFIYAEGINLYANTNCGKLSNVATDDMEGTLLAFKSGKSSQYTIRFDNLNGETFMLVDLESGAQVAMTEGNEYTFTQAPNTDNEARFVVMGGNKTPTGSEVIRSNKITKVVENGQFYIIKDGLRYNAVGASLIK